MNQTTQTPPPRQVAPSTKSDTPSGGSRLDTVWLIGALALVVGGIAAFYMLEEQLANAAVRAALVLLGLAGASFMLYQTAVGRTAWSYVRDSYRIELRKVVWPTRQETLQTTLMIAVVVVIMSVMLWGLDSLLLWGVKTITGQG